MNDSNDSTSSLSMGTRSNEAQQGRTLNSAESFYGIGDMARLYGVTLRALRFYEDRGLITPYRQASARYYDAAARARLETILKGKQLGFTLGQIAAMLPREGECGKETNVRLNLEADQVRAQLERLERKRGEMDAAIAELRQTHALMLNGAAQSGSGDSTAVA